MDMIAQTELEIKGLLFTRVNRWGSGEHVREGCRQSACPWRLDGVAQLGAHADQLLRQIHACGASWPWTTARLRPWLCKDPHPDRRRPRRRRPPLSHGTNGRPKLLARPFVWVGEGPGVRDTRHSGLATDSRATLNGQPAWEAVSGLWRQDEQLEPLEGGEEKRRSSSIGRSEADAAPRSSI